PDEAIACEASQVLSGSTDLSRNGTLSFSSSARGPVLPKRKAPSSALGAPQVLLEAAYSVRNESPKPRSFQPLTRPGFERDRGAIRARRSRMTGSVLVSRAERPTP